MARPTRQRSAVAGLLEDLDEFRSAQELHAVLRDRGEGIGLATVYRTLQALADGGEVDVLRRADGEAVYRRCARREHHHHLICRSCGATVEIDGPSVEAWAAQVGDAHGFSDIDHTLELYGTCARCVGASRASRTRPAAGGAEA